MELLPAEMSPEMEPDDAAEMSCRAEMEPDDAVVRGGSGLLCIMQSCAEQISALQAEACLLAEQACRDGDAGACSMFRDSIVAQPALASGIAKIRSTFQAELKEHSSMEQMADAVRVAERHRANPLVPMVAPEPIPDDDVAATKAVMTATLPAIFKDAPTAPSRVASLAAYESTYREDVANGAPTAPHDATPTGSARLQELQDHEGAVDSASKSATTTIEQLATALTEASKVGLPAESPVLEHATAVLAMLTRRRDAAARIDSLLTSISGQKDTASPAFKPAQRVSDASAVLATAVDELRGCGAGEQAVRIVARNDARRALIASMEQMQACAGKVQGGLNLVDGTLQVALADLRILLSEQVPQLETETVSLCRRAVGAPPTMDDDEEEDERKAPGGGHSFADALARRSAFAHENAAVHDALLQQLAGTIATLQKCSAELEQLRGWEASPPPSPKDLKDALEELEDKRDAVEVITKEHEKAKKRRGSVTLQADVDAAKLAQRGAEHALNALRDAALASVAQKKWRHS